MLGTTLVCMETIYYHGQPAAGACAAALTCAHKAIDGHIPCLAQAIRPVLCWRHSTNADKVERNGWRFVDGSYNVEIRPSVGLVVGGVWTLSKLTGWQHSQLIPHPSKCTVCFTTDDFEQ